MLCIWETPSGWEPQPQKGLPADIWQLLQVLGRADFVLDEVNCLVLNYRVMQRQQHLRRLSGTSTDTGAGTDAPGRRHRAPIGA